MACHASKESLTLATIKSAEGKCFYFLLLPWCFECQLSKGGSVLTFYTMRKDASEYF